MPQDVYASPQVDCFGNLISFVSAGLREPGAAVGVILVEAVVVAAAVGEAVAVWIADVLVVSVSGGTAQAAAAQPRLQEVPLLAEGLVFGIFLQVIAVWSDN